jgi:hypothetical protein
VIGVENRTAIRLQGAAAGFCWGLLIYLLFGMYLSLGLDLTAAPFWMPLRLLSYILILVAPALTFFPISRMLELGRFAYFGTISWAAFGFVVAYVDPTAGGRVSVPAYLVFLVLLFAAILALFVPISFAVGFKLLSLRVHKHDLARAWRESALVAIFGVVCLVLQAIDIFSPVNALLFFLIIALVEVFFLARKE